jgi:hypothetical protein
MGQSRMAIRFVLLFFAGGMDVLSSTAAGKQPEWILELSRFYLVIIRGLFPLVVIMLYADQPATINKCTGRSDIP